MLQQDQYTIQKLHGFGAVVVAHLVERLLPVPKVCGSNPVIGKRSLDGCYGYAWMWKIGQFTVNCVEKPKIKEKEAGNGPFLKNVLF